MKSPHAVFIDRDGVIDEIRADHVKCWSELRLLPGAVEAIARLTQAVTRVFVVTNVVDSSAGIAVARRMPLIVLAQRDLNFGLTAF